MDVQTKKSGNYICIAFIFNPATYYERYLQLRTYILQNKINVYPHVYEIFMPKNYSPFREDEFIVELKLRLK
jgi:MerR family transcriptional regulator, activator of bmr gene